MGRRSDATTDFWDGTDKDRIKRRKQSDQNELVLWPCPMRPEHELRCCVSRPGLRYERVKFQRTTGMVGLLGSTVPKFKSGIALLAQKLAHLRNDFTLFVDEAMMVRVGEYND